MTVTVYVFGTYPNDDLRRRVLRPARQAYPEVRFEWLRQPPKDLAKQPGVYLVTGAEPFKAAQAAGWFPKNRGVDSMRWTPTRVGKAVVMASYAPGLAVFNPGREVEVSWGFTLAARYAATGTTAPTFGKYRYVRDLKPVIRAIREERALFRGARRVPVAFDTETIGLDPWRPASATAPAARFVSLQFTVRPGTAYVVYVLGRRGAALEAIKDQLRRIVTSPVVHLIGANLKYDSVWLRQQWGIEITNQGDDTLLMGALLDENRSNSLKLHAKLYTALGGYDDELASQYPKGRMDLVPKDVLLRYAGADPDATLRVWKAMRSELREDRRLNTFYRELLLPSARAFEAIEHRGVCVDKKRYASLRREVCEAIREAHDNAIRLMPASIRKRHAHALSLTRGDLLIDLFYTRHGFGFKPQHRTPTRKPSTSIEHLQEFDNDPRAREFIAAYSQFSKAKKTLSTYIDGFLRHLRSDGRFHPTYLLGHVEVEGGVEGGPVTGRSSTKDPAYQTIPKHTAWATPLRSVIIPPPGHVILKADVSQGELRVAACVANERSMIAAYRQGIDLHLKTGCQVNDIPLKKALAMREDPANKDRIKRIRQGGKAGNFGLLYTMQPAGFQRYARRQYGVDLSMDQAVKFHHDFFSLYPDLTRWHQDTREFVRRRGYVRSPLGRIRHLPLIHSRDRELSSQAERQAINSPIQATLSDLVQLLIVMLARRWPKLWVFGFCHDSVEMYVPENEVEVWGRRLHTTMAELPLATFGWNPQLPFPLDIELATKHLGDTVELKA